MNMPSKAVPSRILMHLMLASPVIVASFNIGAAAQEAPVTEVKTPSKPASQPMQQVEVKGSAATYDARRDDTATKIVVTQEEILRNGDTTIGEVLKRLPGVTIGGVQGRGGDIRMRGLGNGYTQVLLNGEPSPAGFSMDSLAPDMIERIEVMRAGSAEYSTQAIAGVINIVLKKQIVTAQRELKLGAQTENGKPGVTTNFQVSDKKGAMSYAIGGGVNYFEYDRPSQDITRGVTAAGVQDLLRVGDNNNSGKILGVNLAPRINWTLGPGDVLTSQSFVNVNNFKGLSLGHVTTLVGAPPRYSGTVVDIDSKAAMLRSDLTWSRKLSAGAKLDTKFGVNYNHRETTAPSEEFYGDGTLALNRLITSDSTDKGFSANGKYSTPVLENHALAVGWDAAYSKRIEDRIQRESSTVGAPHENLDQFFDADVSRLAMFAQDEWSVTRQWSVYGGLRWEGIRTRSAGNAYATVDNRSSVWSPVFQTLYKFEGSKNDQLRLGVTRTYKAPSVNSLVPRRFASSNNSQTSPDQQGNPALRPELSWGLDLAYEHYLAGGGMLSASTYARRIQDITHNTTTLINGLWVSMPINDGVANTHGIELEAKLPLRSVWKEAPAVDLRANLARNWSTLSNVPGPDNRLDQQTPVSGNLGADYKMTSLPLTMGGSYSFQNGGPVRVTFNQYAYSVPKRTLDLYGLWKFSPKTQLRVSLANALHQQNVSASTYVDASRYAYSDTSFNPTSATVRAMLEMKL
jgi:outer membrane receptor protein involved in Fe transport